MEKLIIAYSKELKKVFTLDEDYSVLSAVSVPVDYIDSHVTGLHLRLLELHDEVEIEKVYPSSLLFTKLKETL
jgi:hypothetical protein